MNYFLGLNERPYLIPETMGYLKIKDQIDGRKEGPEWLLGRKRPL